MYYGFSALIGVIIGVMLLINGELTAAIGVYSATVVIHIVGLLLVLLILCIRREKFRLFPKGIPAYYFIGGVIGVVTTVCNNAAFGKISVSAILGIGLFGQAVTALAIDCLGVLGMPRRSLHLSDLPGILLVFGGILVLLLPLEDGGAIAAVLSFITGVTVVTSRMTNAQLSERVGAMQSTLYNYITGLTTAFVVMVLLGRGEPMLQRGFAAFSPNLLIYTGGMLGVASVVLSNVTAHRIPGFIMTLFLFVGQVFTGIVIDAVLDQGVDLRNVIGGALVAAGMALNLYLDNRRARGQAA